MEPKPNHTNSILMSVFVLALSAHILVLSSGCEGGGGDGPDGSSTVQGTVDSFSSSGAFYMPTEPGGPLEQLARHILNVIVPQAHAAVRGVTVSVQGTGLSGTTDDTGFFIISGVPPGAQVLEYTLNGQTERLNVNVPDNGIVTLNNITIGGGSVRVASVQVVEFDDDDDDNGNSNDNDDNGNDNDDDDNGNDNSDNSNSNDNDDNDDDDDDNDND